MGGHVENKDSGVILIMQFKLLLVWKMFLCSVLKSFAMFYLAVHC